MHSKVLYGLLVGCAGLLLNIFVAAGMGCCGPFVSILAGGIAGFLAVRKGFAPSKSDGAKWGIVAGSIAGGLVFVGQVIGTFSVSILMSLIDESVAEALSSSAGRFAATGTMLVIGAVGVVLAIMAGTGGGYWGTRASSN